MRADPGSPWSPSVCGPRQVVGAVVAPPAEDGVAVGVDRDLRAGHLARANHLRRAQNAGGRARPTLDRGREPARDRVHTNTESPSASTATWGKKPFPPPGESSWTAPRAPAADRGRLSARKSPFRSRVHVKTASPPESTPTSEQSWPVRSGETSWIALRPPAPLRPRAWTVNGRSGVPCSAVQEITASPSASTATVRTLGAHRGRRHVLDRGEASGGVHRTDLGPLDVVFGPHPREHGVAIGIDRDLRFGGVFAREGQVAHGAEHAGRREGGGPDPGVGAVEVGPDEDRVPVGVDRDLGRERLAEAIVESDARERVHGSPHTRRAPPQDLRSEVDPVRSQPDEGRVARRVDSDRRLDRRLAGR